MADNAPNPQKKYRNALIAAIKQQQETIQTQGQHIAVLSTAVQTLVAAAGADRHPRFASLMSLAGTPDDAPATTTEQARTPDATDSPESKGAAPAPANTEVTPAATTDVSTPAVVLPEDNPLDHLQDVTAPVAGTDAVPSTTVFNGDVKTPATPTSDVLDPAGSSGWTGTPGSTNRTSAMGGEQERFVAAMRLARLQIALGQAQGEDLAVAEVIASSAQPLSEINAVASALSSVAVQRQASRQPGPGDRRLVPQASGGQQRQAGITPSFQQAPAALPAVVAGRGEDEFLFGTGDPNS